jgi:hypothetical protein
MEFLNGPGGDQGCDVVKGAATASIRIDRIWLARRSRAGTADPPRNPG